MQINIEKADKHAIQSYSETTIKVDSIVYDKSVIISKEEINPLWEISSICDLDESLIASLLKYKPEVIIIGHNQTGILPPFPVLQYLSKLRVGIECMSIGAASRTFNVLLSENRAVVAGIIL